MVKNLKLKKEGDTLTLENNELKIFLKVKHKGSTNSAPGRNSRDYRHWYSCYLKINTPEKPVLEETFNYYGSVYDYQKGNIYSTKEDYLNIIENFFSDITFLDSEGINSLEEYLRAFTEVRTTYEKEMTKGELEEFRSAKRVFNVCDNLRRKYRGELDLIYEISDYLREELGAG